MPEPPRCHGFADGAQAANGLSTTADRTDCPRGETAATRPNLGQKLLAAEYSPDSNESTRDPETGQELQTGARFLPFRSFRSSGRRPASWTDRLTFPFFQPSHAAWQWKVRQRFQRLKASSSHVTAGRHGRIRRGGERRRFELRQEIPVPQFKHQESPDSN